MIRLIAFLMLANLAHAELDPNERHEALRHLAIVHKEANLLVKLSSQPATEPTTPGALAPAAAAKASADLLEAAEDLRAELARANAAESEFVDRFDALENAAVALEPALPAFPRGGGARSRYSNVRWSVQRIAALLNLEDEERPTFTVGPVTAEQRLALDQRLTALLDRATALKSALDAADPEMMYRNLLINQMGAFVQPAATLRVALKDPWWTPEAYQAVTQVTRLIDLTKNETRKLTPELLESLQGVWSASEELVAAANDIEKGARGTGPDATINYLPRPKK
jgi:hypothetical protein